MHLKSIIQNQNMVILLLLVLLKFIELNFKLTHCLGYTSFDESDAEYWYEMARANLRERLDIFRPLHNRARNVIIFLGDGMSISTITASRILKGQLKGNKGEEEFLEFDRFPHSALIKVILVIDCQIFGLLSI